MATTHSKTHIGTDSHLYDRSKETEEVFFVQNAGARNASTGLKKSAIIEKISLVEAAAVASKSDAVGLVKVTSIPSSPMVINPNGKLRYRLFRDTTNFRLTGDKK